MPTQQGQLIAGTLEDGEAGLPQALPGHEAALQAGPLRQEARRLQGAPDPVSRTHSGQEGQVQLLRSEAMFMKLCHDGFFEAHLNLSRGPLHPFSHRLQHLFVLHSEVQIRRPAGAQHERPRCTRCLIRRAAGSESLINPGATTSIIDGRALSAFPSSVPPVLWLKPSLAVLLHHSEGFLRQHPALQLHLLPLRQACNDSTSLLWLQALK
mmetsp:Transcript_54300/g.118904  ORF Transcript_54300/g.118904 Transcript_54300/m.118904 type:complete len:210 (-) Transcript_54300:251-880(-)